MLPVLLSRRVIQAGVGTLPNPGLMEHGVFGGYGVDGVDGFPFELNFIICNLKWRVGFSFSFLSLFFKEDNSTLLCWNILNFFVVLNGEAFVE